MTSKGQLVKLIQGGWDRADTVAPVTSPDDKVIGVVLSAPDEDNRAWISISGQTKVELPTRRLWWERIRNRVMRTIRDMDDTVAIVVAGVVSIGLTILLMLSIAGCDGDTFIEGDTITNAKCRTTNPTQTSTVVCCEFPPPSKTLCHTWHADLFEVSEYDDRGYVFVVAAGTPKPCDCQTDCYDCTIMAGPDNNPTTPSGRPSTGCRIFCPHQEDQTCIDCPSCVSTAQLLECANEIRQERIDRGN